jgi:hypothetical protein
VIKAESQVVLNTLREHAFQDAFKNGRSAGKGVSVEGDYFEDDGGL